MFDFALEIEKARIASREYERRETAEAAREAAEADRKAEMAACPTCQRDDPRGPAHFASRRCESGRRNHCTCDTCY
jgi:hypothetical protein